MAEKIKSKPKTLNTWVYIFTQDIYLISSLTDSAVQIPVGFSRPEYRFAQNQLKP